MAENRAEQILQTMLAFDVKSDFDSMENREGMADAFREFMTSTDPNVVEVLPKFLDALKEVLSNLGVGEEKTKDEFGEPENEEEKPEEKINPEEENEEATKNLPLESKVSDKTKRLVEHANNFIY